MPKVYLSEQEKLNSRLASWVYGEMKLHHVTQQDLADELGISRQAVGKKLSKQRFEFDDFCCFIRVFKPESKDLERLLGV